MERARISITVVLLWALLGVPGQAFATRSGPMVNPFTETSWQEIFPLKIAGVTVMTGGTYDTPDPATQPICVCPAPPPVFYRVGISASFWEPARAVEVTKTPFYFPLAGFGVGNGLVARGTLGGTTGDASGAGQGENTVGQAHFIIYPVWAVLEMLTDMVCIEHSGLDYAYITEIDPLWQDSELALLIQPEALLFANPIATLSCMVDAVSVNLWRPMEALFWCAGSGGPVYPLSGRAALGDYTQGAALLAHRMIFKLSREMLLCDTGVNLCGCMPLPIWVKPNYKLQALRPMVQYQAWPIGKSDFFYGAGLNPPITGATGPPDEFLWLLFRKRVCCVL